MACRTCIELEQFLHSALQPESPELLNGLTERGLKNKSQQREEKIAKQRTLLEKHKKVCVEDSGQQAAN